MRAAAGGAAPCCRRATHGSAPMTGSRSITRRRPSADPFATGTAELRLLQNFSNPGDSFSVHIAVDNGSRRWNSRQSVQQRSHVHRQVAGIAPQRSVRKCVKIAVRACDRDHLCAAAAGSNGARQSLLVFGGKAMAQQHQIEITGLEVIHRVANRCSRHKEVPSRVPH